MLYLRYHFRSADFLRQSYISTQKYNAPFSTQIGYLGIESVNCLTSVTPYEEFFKWRSLLGGVSLL